MGMSIGTATLIVLAGVAGVTFPLLLLSCRPRSGRGWCRRCQTPDLWIISRHTGRSRAWAVLAWGLHAAMAACAIHLVRMWGMADPRDGVILGLLLAGEILVAQRSRLSRRRMIRCRMCEAEAAPQDLRRAAS
jgi:hypothetical protein